MTRTITETVQLSRFVGGAEDAYGNPVEGYADPVSVGIWRFSPGTSTDPVLAGHDRTITQPVIYGPTPMGPRDRVEVRGLVYEVDGDHPEWVNDTVRGYEIPLRRVDG